MISVKKVNLRLFISSNRLENKKKNTQTKILFFSLKVQDVKDDVDFYIENNGQADFPENMDNLDLFDDLELEKYDDSAASACKPCSFHLKYYRSRF